MMFKELSPGWNRFAWVLLFATLLSLSFPPLQLGFLAYWALIPLFYLLHDLTPREALKWGYIAGFFWNLGTLYWVAWVTVPGLIGMLLILPLYLMGYAWLHVLLKKRYGEAFLFLVPPLWVAMEYVKSLGAIGFPWTLLAYTQTYYTRLIQYADHTGVYGVSAWVVVINVILFYLLLKRFKLRQAIPWLVGLLLLFLLPLLYSMLVMPSEEDFKERIHIGLVQGNIDPYLKWDASFLGRNFAIYDSLTSTLQGKNLDLIVWPETATACYLRARPAYLSRVFDIAARVQAPILTGTPDYAYTSDTTYQTYNGLMLIQPGDYRLQTYWKMHLVPFGERVPYEDSIPFLHNFLESLNMGTGDFSEGKEYKLFTMRWRGKSLPFAGVICFESIFPDQVRRFIKMGGRFLVIVTNDGWYGNTSGPYQHNRIAVFRAIENRVGIARCANTGISSFIDPYGRMLEKTRFDEMTTLIGTVPLRQETTFYTLHGDIFAYVMVGLSGMAAFGTVLKRS